MINIKIIFLDIDGVLNTTKTFIKRKENFKRTGIWCYKIDLFRIEYLKEIIDKTNAKIVLTSTIRNGFKKENEILVPITNTAIEINNLLKKYNLEIFDITGLDKNGRREIEIKKWLEINDVESFIIIDDETYDLNNYIDYVIKTRENNIEIGLCSFHIDKAVNMLNKKRLVLKNNHNKK